MELIHAPLATATPGLKPLRIPVERLTLAKRRWRGVAEDGTEFGFDLTVPLGDGAPVFATAEALYIIAQKYEPVLELRIADCEPSGARQTAEGGPKGEAGGPSQSRIGTDAARLGWLIGNLHFQMEITDEVVRVADDPALRQLFEREHIAFVACARVFHPLGGSAAHGHHHH